MTTLKPISLSNETKLKLKGPLSSDLIKTRDGAKGAQLKYYDGYTIIDALNIIFGYAWSFRIIKTWIEPCEPTEYNGKVQPQKPIANVLVELTVPLETEKGEIIYITKTSTGSKMITGNQSAQQDNFKAAQTDALKKAASLFGIGAELYRKSEDEEYFFEKSFYGSMWTDELYEKYKEELDYLNKYEEENEVTEEQFNDHMYNATDGEYVYYVQLCPDNIGLLVQYLKDNDE